MKKALIVVALAEFIRSFLTSDIEILQSMGYEVHCAANINHPGKGGMNEYFREHNIIFHQIDFSSNKPLSKQTIKAYKQFRTLINEDNYDVVHCHTPIVGAICRWACKKHRKKHGQIVIYTTHGFYFHKGSSKKSWILYGNIEKFMSRYCDAVITINHEDYTNAKKMNCKNVFHINGVGVDINKYRNAKIDRMTYRQKLGISEESLVVLGIGELSERKNHKVVIEALGKLKRSDTVFLHCGNAMNASGTLETLKRIAESYNVKIIFAGLRSDIPQICKCADIGTISSTREGLGLAGIEMLASGLPLAASKVHGILDYVVDGVNGYLADPYSSDEFAEAIGKLTDKAVREKMSLVCSHSVDKFDISISKDQRKEIYHKLICECN